MVDSESIGNAGSPHSFRLVNRVEPDRRSSDAWAYVMARTCAQRLPTTDRESEGGVKGPNGPVGTQTRAMDPFFNDVLACMNELSQQQRAVLLADLAAGGSVSAAKLAQELRTSRNTIYVARNAGRKALRAALLERGYVLGYVAAWSLPTN